MQDTAPGQDLRIGEALADWIARRAHPIGLGIGPGQVGRGRSAGLRHRGGAGMPRSPR